jgi:hypothetical protein
MNDNISTFSGWNSAAVVRFGPVQGVQDENREPNHGPVLQNLRTQNWTIENRSLRSGPVFFWSELEPNRKFFYSERKKNVDKMLVYTLSS